MQNMRSRQYDQVDSNAAPQQKTFLDYSWKACKLFGIPIYIHYLLPLFFLLFVWMLFIVHYFNLFISNHLKLRTKLTPNKLRKIIFKLSLTILVFSNVYF